MKYGSVCSGIEAATVAWHHMGWQPSFFSDIEKFPQQVLAYHYPDIPCHGDFTTIQKDIYEPIDLLVGGTPCQSFSVAGKRLGMADSRGNLAIEYLKLARRLNARWFVWENVPGVLSSNGGDDFSAFLSLVGECGYGYAYRVLDAQYFGVPQRRRRVFVVGYFGDWRAAAAVLFERESLRGDITPRRAAREGIAENDGIRIASGKSTFGTLMANCGSQQWLGNQEALSGDYHILQSICYGIPGNWIGRLPENGGNAVEPMHNMSPCLTKTDRHAVAYDMRGREGGAQFEGPHDTANIRAASGGSSRSYVVSSAVRRLTPRECERLQGFPDDYTLISIHGKHAADSLRYKSLGNSMAVPVMKWIGERINLVEQYINQ